MGLCSDDNGGYNSGQDYEARDRIARVERRIDTLIRLLLHEDLPQALRNEVRKLLPESTETELRLERMRRQAAGLLP